MGRYRKDEERHSLYFWEKERDVASTFVGSNKREKGGGEKEPSFSNLRKGERSRLLYSY